MKLSDISEERRLGVLTDRQESSAIGLIQSWAELDTAVSVGGLKVCTGCCVACVVGLFVCLFSEKLKLLK